MSRFPELDAKLQREQREITRVCALAHHHGWQVIDYHCNYSAFNGYHRTPSAYSKCRCAVCGRVWRTNAAYVETLPDAPADWWQS